jgi:hypothetical protein
MILATYCIAIVFFCITFYLTKLPATCNQIFDISKQAITTITDSELDDFAKESATQIAAISMLKKSFILLVKLSAIFGATILPILLADFVGIANYNDIGEFALRLDVLLITTLVASILFFTGRKLFR